MAGGFQHDSLAAYCMTKAKEEKEKSGHQVGQVLEQKERSFWHFQRINEDVHTLAHYTRGFFGISENR